MQGFIIRCGRPPASIICGLPTAECRIRQKIGSRYMHQPPGHTQLHLGGKIYRFWYGSVKIKTMKPYAYGYRDKELFKEKLFNLHNKSTH